MESNAINCCFQMEYLSRKGFWKRVLVTGSSSESRGELSPGGEAIEKEYSLILFRIMEREEHKMTSNGDEPWLQLEWKSDCVVLFKGDELWRGDG